MTPRPKKSVARPAAYARGGKNHMVKPHAAGPARPAITGKAQTAAPGAKSAKGGSNRPVGGTAVPAKAGRTAS